MSIKVINFTNKDLPRSTNPGKIRKLPQNRPKIDLDEILNKISPKEEKIEEKKVLFNEVVEIAQYEKPPELVRIPSPLNKKNTVVELLHSKSPSPKRKQKEITEYFKKEIETLDNKLGKRTRSPSPIRTSSPVRNYYKTNYNNNTDKKIRMRRIKLKLDRNWFKKRDRIVYEPSLLEKLEKTKLLYKRPYEDLFIGKFILGY
jgi:hypothetical protein